MSFHHISRKLLLFGLLVGGGCSGVPMLPQLPQGPPVQNPAGSPQPEAMARDVFERINRRRESVGLRPLVWDATLAYLAAEHSNEMAAGRRPFGHDGFEARMAAARSAIPVARGSENVGRNTYPAGQSVAAAVTGWIESPGHRQNLEGNFQLTGVGVARAPNGEYFLTQLFVGS